MVTGTYSGRGIAIGRAVHDDRVRIQRAHVQRGVDLGEGSARGGVDRAINVIAGNVRRRARGPGQVYRVGWCRRAGASQRCSRHGSLCIAREGKGSSGRSSGLRTESHGKRSALTRWDGRRY